MANNESIGLLPVWEPENADEANVDIVFIHGLGGNRKDTWTFEQTREFPASFWPQELLPKQAPTARILTFGYNADFVHFYFSKKNTPTERPIIFVAHSLGGLVCANALSRSRAGDEASKLLIDHTCGTIFLGTPFEGSTKSKPGVTALNFLKLLRQDTNKEDVEELNKESEKLAEIRNEFLKFLKERDVQGAPVAVACFFETSPTFLFEVKKRKTLDLGVIVSKESATLPGFDPVPISANHSYICKFAGEWESGFQSVSLLLARWIENIGVESRPDEPNRIYVSGDISYENAQVYGGVLAGHVVSTKKDGNKIIGSTGNPTYNINQPGHPGQTKHT
ncbi:hypothetical protein N0V90_012668 [Kalmusia sp. IMI 367209]|nr:hypothetical protein N0V90_012668 [Kalmusia sp. IMI 367209]